MAQQCNPNPSTYSPECQHGFTCQAIAPGSPAGMCVVDPPTPEPTSQDSSYEVDDNGCVAYGEGTNDDNCRNAEGMGLFNGYTYSHSYMCNEGVGYACCESTYEYQNDVTDLGQCVRNQCSPNTYTPVCQNGFTCQAVAPGSPAGMCVASNDPPIPIPIASPTPAPISQDPPSYDVVGNGCVAYSEGVTDDSCRNAAKLGLFKGDTYSHSYKCTEGVGYACCKSTYTYQNNVPELGQCTRNYQEDDQGCIPDSCCESDECCATATGFSGHPYNYQCSTGEYLACCNSDVSKFPNVKDLGRCVRTTSDSENYSQQNVNCKAPY